MTTMMIKMMMMIKTIMYTMTMIMMSDYDDDEYVGHGHDDGDDAYENDGGHDDNGHGHSVKEDTDCNNRYPA